MEQLASLLGDQPDMRSLAFAARLSVETWKRFGAHALWAGNVPPEMGVEQGCLIWMGERSPRGYGRFYITRTKRVMAHRLVWAGEHGPIPDGMEVCHACDNPPCINGKHLFLGTHTDNMRDASQKGRLYRNGHSPSRYTWLRNTSAERPKSLLRVHCKRNHPLTPENTLVVRIGSKGTARRCRTCRAFNRATYNLHRRKTAAQPSHQQ